VLGTTDLFGCRRSVTARQTPSKHTCRPPRGCVVAVKRLPTQRSSTAVTVAPSQSAPLFVVVYTGWFVCSKSGRPTDQQVPDWPT